MCVTRHDSLIYTRHDETWLVCKWMYTRHDSCMCATCVRWLVCMVVAGRKDNLNCRSSCPFCSTVYDTWLVSFVHDSLCILCTWLVVYRLYMNICETWLVVYERCLVNMYETFMCKRVMSHIQRVMSHIQRVMSRIYLYERCLFNRYETWHASLICMYVCMWYVCMWDICMYVRHDLTC